MKYIFSFLFSNPDSEKSDTGNLISNDKIVANMMFYEK